MVVGKDNRECRLVRSIVMNVSSDNSAVIGFFGRNGGCRKRCGEEEATNEDAIEEDAIEEDEVPCCE